VRFLRCCRRKRPRIVFLVDLPTGGSQPLHGVLKMLVLNNEQKVALSVEGRSAGGNVVDVSGVPSWVVSDPAVASLEVAADGRSAVLVAVSVGSASVTVTDANGAAGSLDVSVESAAATSLVITAGAPELK
jgi:hypothetical protein